MSPKHQAAITRAARDKDTADRKWRDTIRAAHEDGASVRELAKVAQVAPGTIQKILNEPGA